MDVVKIMLDSIRKELKQNIDPAYKQGAINFFKEPIKCHGVRASIVRKIAGEYFKKTKGMSKARIFDLCEDFLKTNYNEEASIAFNWCFRLQKQFEKSDFVRFEQWVKRYLTNWAMVDDFCTHSVGKLITDFPELIPKIKSWAKSKNRWVRRSSAVCFIYSTHTYSTKQKIKDIFDIADILLLDEDDMVRKGYGWMLKAASHKYPKEVFDFVMKRKNKMPRTALRYAIEKYPKKMRAGAMEK